MAANSNALHWPALDLRGADLPSRLNCERGIWGKVHGAASDYRWIAGTNALQAADKRLEEEMPLGSADVSQTTVLWRTLGDTCYAIAVYPSAATDVTGRTGFLERQLLEWKRPADVPAALGALLLVPAVAGLERPESSAAPQVQWSSEDRGNELDSFPAVPVSPSAIEGAIADGLRALTAACTEEALAEFYAALLAGGRAVSLRGLSAPLPPAALAALLLPLPRDVADWLSMAGWLPSSWLSDDGAHELRRCWDVVAGGATPIPAADAPPPSADQLSRAQVMARSIFAGSPAGEARASLHGPGKPIELTLWGPASAGKTVLLAQMYLDSAAKVETTSKWEVFPTGASLAFFRNMRARMQTSNLFPVATSAGQVEGIEYVFKHHPSGVRSFLHLEDRAGLYSETLDEKSGGQISLMQRLGSADGLILLFDPISDERILESRVWRTLEQIYNARGGIGDKDARPIAVCVSKADTLIETPADFRRAVEEPDDFVRDHVSDALVRPLDHYCQTYRLFPVSAVGIRLRHGVIEPAMFIDEGLQPRICPGSRPFNLMAPFAWLLHELTGVA